MMTVMTHVALREGAEPEWDAVMRDRLGNANGRPGFVRSQLLMPLDALNRRVIVGTWETRSDWEAWHNDELFLATRQRLEDLQADPGETSWYEVVEDQPPVGPGRFVDATITRARRLVDRMGGRATNR